jgi:hypothetical protein
MVNYLNVWFAQSRSNANHEILTIIRIRELETVSSDESQRENYRLFQSQDGLIRQPPHLLLILCLNSFRLKFVCHDIFLDSFINYFNKILQILQYLSSLFCEFIPFLPCGPLLQMMLNQREFKEF